MLATRGGVAVQSASGSSRAASAHPTPLAGVSYDWLRSSRGTRPLRGNLAAVIAVGNAEIKRLVALDLPVYCGGPRGNEVAFTFDDGPGVYTYLALKKLRQAHARATFFVVGKSINSFPGYLSRELKVAAIGDHTYTHPDLVALSPGQVMFQLQRTAQMIRAQAGEHVDLWRPPYEAYDASVQGIAKHLGLLEILWSVDSRDWLKRAGRRSSRSSRPGCDPVRSSSSTRTMARRSAR